MAISTDDAQHPVATVVHESQDREQKRRIWWISVSAASYAVDGLFLALFAYAGTISSSVAPLYGLAATVVSLTTYWMTETGLNLKFREQNLIAPQMAFGIAMQLGVVLAAPQVAFPFLANLFTVFSFGMIWMSLRNSIAVWTLGVAGIGIVLYLVEGRIGVPNANLFEVVLVWLYFSMILARCLLLSVNANEIRSRLAESRHKLAVTLETVQQLANHDDLTGTLNRRSLMAALERERIRAERSGAPFSVAIIDLDYFKKVNDTYGHAAGDAVLRTVAATVSATMRATDVFGRFGGEEFLMILVGAAPPVAKDAMERIRIAVAGKDWTSIAPELPVTLSAGIASYQKGESVGQLLHNADMALYQAKHLGRNRVVSSS